MTKGTLTNGTVEIKGALNYKEGGGTSFTPEGSSLGTFFNGSEWTFTPDKKPLPHPDNVVIVRIGFYPIVGIHDEWYQVESGRSLRPVSEGEVRAIIPRARAVYQSGKELNKEDYV